MRAWRQRWRSMESRREPYNLTILSIETVMGPGFACVPFIDPAAHPHRPGAAGRPLHERRDTGRQGRPAAILAVMDDERTRQRCRRTEDRHDVLAAARFGAEKP